MDRFVTLEFFWTIYRPDLTKFRVEVWAGLRYFKVKLKNELNKRPFLSSIKM